MRQAFLWGASLLVLAVATSLGVLVYPELRMPRVEPHAGDGTFTNISWRYPYGNIGLPIPGYRIEFESFALAEEFEATYQVGKLPDFDSPRIYLCVSDEDNRAFNDNLKKEFQATLEIKVIGSTGATVLHLSSPLSEMTWSSGSGRRTFGLYVLENSRFQPNRGETYRIHVRYSPDARFEDATGFVYLRCGGSV